jgi:hypothetical protein
MAPVAVALMWCDRTPGGAPDMMLDLKAVGRRLGLGGSSPPHKRFRGSRWYATHLL